MDNVLRVLQFIWGPAVEMMILTVAIYYVLSFVRGTRGFSILIGFLSVLLVMAFVTSFFQTQLAVLHWLLGTFSTFVAVAGSAPSPNAARPRVRPRPRPPPAPATTRAPRA